MSNSRDRKDSALTRRNFLFVMAGGLVANLNTLMRSGTAAIVAVAGKGMSQSRATPVRRPAGPIDSIFEPMELSNIKEAGKI